jgi:hypothetical protein
LSFTAAPRVSAVIAEADLQSGRVDNSELDRGCRAGGPSSLDPGDQQFSAFGRKLCRLLGRAINPSAAPAVAALGQSILSADG